MSRSRKSLMCSTYKEGKSVVAERFIRNLKAKIYKKMTVIDQINKLVDEYNNFYHRSTGKKHIHADYSALIKEIESIHEALNLKFGDRVRITKYKNIFSKS